nr:MAG TPA: hypothetical protein [Caudoviricetes sp.]
MPSFFYCNYKKGIDFFKKYSIILKNAIKRRNNGKSKI